MHSFEAEEPIESQEEEKRYIASACSAVLAEGYVNIGSAIDVIEVIAIELN